MIDFKAVNRVVKGIDRVAVNKDRHDRFKALVAAHGVELVSIASGLAQATVKVYASSRRHIPTIGLEPLLQAEHVFKVLTTK